MLSIEQHATEHAARASVLFGPPPYALEIDLKARPWFYASIKRGEHYLSISARIPNDCAPERYAQAFRAALAKLQS